MRRFTSVFFLLFLFSIDLYVFQALRTVLHQAGPRAKMLVYAVYWLISASGITVLALLPYLHYEQWPRSIRTYAVAIIIGLFFSKLLTTVFLLLDDLRRGVQWVAEKVMTSLSPIPSDEIQGISRSHFLTRMGLLVGGGLFATLLYGFSNKYNYKVRRIRLRFDHLPASFRGLKLVQLSDIHSGSFDNPQAVMKGVSKVLEEKPDLILFTGDLVNNRATEMTDYIPIFSRLQAPMGVYATLGNHDYGDYTNWETAAAKRQNLEKLKAIHAKMGWRLLMNEHVVLEKNGEQIALLGVENWSAKRRFPKHGDLKKAYTGAEAYPFKILMSHDPSHWDAEVIPHYSDIDLTLAGHTHGMQFGVEIPGLKWSPVQYFYKQWAGLYEVGRQKLYVNRGFGFIGYPGRVGILPEITVIELV